MAHDRVIHLYGEDRGHIQFVEPMLRRILREGSVRAVVETRNAQGGHGRAINEFKAWQKATQKGLIAGRPDLLVLVIDANCVGLNQKLRELTSIIDRTVFPEAVIGCPDPHVERWCLADPAAFHHVVGTRPPPDPGKCERNLYKKLLRRAVDEAGLPIVTDVMEIAPELVDAMDLYHAGQTQDALGRFIDDVRRVVLGWSRA